MAANLDPQHGRGCKRITRRVTKKADTHPGICFFAAGDSNDLI
jgi:hypothetical protein